MKLKTKSRHGVSSTSLHGLTAGSVFSLPTDIATNVLMVTLMNSNAYYPPHKHSGLTTHLILRGQLTIQYPDDAKPLKETFGPGARVDVDAGRRHEVWMGSEGCTYVIGE